MFRNLFASILCSYSLIALSPAPAQATLIGDTVQFESVIFSSVVIDSGSFLVQAGPSEVTDLNLHNAGPIWTLDVEDSSIAVTLTGAISVGVASLPLTFLRVFDLDWTGPSGSIIGASISSIGIGGTPTVSFLSDEITVDLTNVTGWSGQNIASFVVDLSVQHDTTAIPEPATLILFGFGLLALGITARRRKTTPTC
ncbi:PEP-CTERM sorting domain-containing protein [Pelagibius sp.]|uniref:PEP-CTERM sorting domain-containing protein n=1 Tax=Pelagibius sp. TaxID=1931238 RepID=UPI002634D170|nr:PEP-CTERM sorting domain-containing protein [Pelagibius sp.]